MRPKAWMHRAQPKVCFAVAFLFFVASLFCRDFISFAQTATPAIAPPPLTDSQRSFFEAKIRPVLAGKCYQCHSPQAKQVEDNLLLDTRAGVLRGGDDGPVIVAKNPEKSLLIEALRYKNKDLQMPPPDSGGQLPDAVIRDFENWIRMGAPDPRDGGPVGAAPAKPANPTEAKKWWSFQPPKRSTMPQVSDPTWVRNNIDKYVMAGLDAKSLKPVADADKLTLIRRIYFDLIGLPPTPAEVDAFLKDESPSAYEKVVDDLLARPQFGEHWGRHWLDVARYAESSGKDFNVTFPNAWRYRDYVIASFNQDKPYNQFVTEQLAGDLLPAPSPAKRAEQLIATGFLAVGPKGLDEQIPRQFNLDMADEQLDTTSQAFIALTVSCARCHDHKFDPVLQTDYYAMAGIFLSTRTDYGTVAGPKNNAGSQLIALPASANVPMVQKPLTPEERDKLKQQLADATTEYNDLVSDRQAQKGPAGKTRRQQEPGQGQNQQNPALKVQQIRIAMGKMAMLENEFNSYDQSGQPKAFCMGVQDRSPTVGKVEPMQPIKMGPKGLAIRDQASGFETIADSPLFFRGEMSEPRSRVPRGVPVFLLSTAPSRQATPRESGRRELADWIVSPHNPLTARVMANRIWYWLFDQGIVASVDNFGTMGDTPSNQPLLDYLALRLTDNKWSIKKTIREVVLSHAYQLASSNDDTDFTADPQNTLIWRHSKRRLTAECIRDAMLQSSGQLDLKAPLGSPVASAGNGALGGGVAYERINEQALVDVTSNYRSVYLPVARDEIPDALAVFDYPDSTVVHGARETTNVPAQGLYMLNSDFVRGQARLVATQLLKSDGNRDDRVDQAFRLILGRPASDSEQKAAGEFFAKLRTDTRIFPPGIWTDFCLALYNTAEFRYLN